MSTENETLTTELSINFTNNNFLYQILEIDSLVFPKEFQSSFQSDAERFVKNKDSYILALNDNAIVGYFCFFPINNELYEQIHQSNSFFDDNISSKQILPYGAVNNIFIISMAIRPEWQHGNAIKLLTQNFKEFLREKENKGMKINSLNCYATSKSGEKLAGKLGMIKNYDVNNLCSFYSSF